jgi:hypothetical protein
MRQIPFFSSLIKTSLLLGGYFLLLSACQQQETASEPAGPGGWLQGSEPEKFGTLARHLRGMDVAMVETGYRYTELYWAGQDQNWEYADYQLQKIRLTLENGLERRPLRAASAQVFMDEVLPEIEEALAAKDSASFRRGFLLLQAGCQSCHVKEGVAFMPPGIPEVRLSPIHYIKP